MSRRYMIWLNDIGGKVSHVSKDRESPSAPILSANKAPAGSPLRPCLHPVLLPQEFKVISEIQLLQETSNQCNLEPKEQCGAWFQVMEPLSEDETYSLSWQCEPLHQWASRRQLFFKANKNRPLSSSGLTRPLTWSEVPLADQTPETSSSAALPQLQGHSWDTYIHPHGKENIISPSSIP